MPNSLTNHIQYKYRYKLFPRVFVTEYILAKQEQAKTGEGYVSESPLEVELQGALDTGYQWIRSDDSIAVFEKQVGYINLG